MAADVLNISKNKNFTDFSISFVEFPTFVYCLCVHLNKKTPSIEIKLSYRIIKGKRSIKSNWYGSDYMNDNDLPETSQGKEITTKPKIRKPCRWDDKHLYLGPAFVEKSEYYAPIVHFPNKCEMLCYPRIMQKDTCKKKKPIRKCNCTNMDFCTTFTPHRENRYGCRFQEEDECEDEEDDSEEEAEALELAQRRRVTFKTNRFGEGIDEKCDSQLFLSLTEVPIEKRPHTKSMELLYPDNPDNPRVSRSYDVIELPRDTLTTIKEDSDEDES